jgi:hypothetical protein
MRSATVIRSAGDNRVMSAVLDPNWFYSTLAQSIAAIVGLLGGFLAQQLLAQRREVGELREAVRQRASHEFTANIEPLRVATQMVIDSLGEIEDRLAQAQEQGERDTSIPNPVECAVLTPPPQGPASVSLGLAERVAVEELPRLKQGIAVATALRDSLPASFEDYSDCLRVKDGLGRPASAALQEPPWSDVRKPEPGPGFGMWLALQRDVAAEHWMRLVESSDPIAEHLRNFRARLVPSSLYWLLIILGVLITTGVAAPIYMLATLDDQRRSAFQDAAVPTVWIGLALFACLALLAFFAVEIARIRRADRLAPDTF